MAPYLIPALSGLAASLSPAEGDKLFAMLLKRQAPGTPEYNCHDNCGKPSIPPFRPLFWLVRRLTTLLFRAGQAVIQTRESDNLCTNEDFISNYQNCLQCAGPDNYDIWRLYGETLADVGEWCGMGIEPAKGKQEDVGPAVTATRGSSSPPLVLCRMARLWYFI